MHPPWVQKASPDHLSSWGDEELGQESQASSCLRKGTPLASPVARGVSGPSSSCVWNPRAFADDARGFILFILLSLGWPFCILAVCGVLFIMEFPHCGWGCIGGLSQSGPGPPGASGGASVPHFGSRAQFSTPSTAPSSCTSAAR